MRTAFIFLLLNISSSFVYGQFMDAAKGRSREQRMDRKPYTGVPVETREFDKQSWKEIVGTTNYDESNTVKEKKKDATSVEKDAGERAVGDSRHQMREDYEEETEDTAPQASSPWAMNGLSTISFAIIALAIVFFLYLIFKDTRLGMRKRTPGKSEATYEVENIQELEVDRLLREAQESGDTRLVVRLHYLNLLKSLHTLNFIRWEKDKTNREYLLEIFDKEVLYHDVRQLTLAYETVWYGEHFLNRDEYNLLIGRFEAVRENINNRTR